MTAVNNNAGKKTPTRKRGKSKSPDVMRKAAPAGTQPFTIGNLLSDNDLSGFQVTHETAWYENETPATSHTKKKQNMLNLPQHHFN